MKNNNQKEKTHEEFYKYIGILHVENTAKKADDIIEKSKHLDFPEELDSWFDEYIGDTIEKEKKKIFKSRVRLIAKRAAIFLIILALGGFITTISVEAYRAKFFNLIMDIKEEYTKISIERDFDDDTNKNDILGKLYFYPGYIPIGYRQSEAQSYGELKVIYFENDKGDRIEFIQTELDSNFQVDTEDATTVEININSSKGILVLKGDLKTLLWFTDTNSFYLTGKIEQEEIVFMAESLEFIK